MVKSSQKWAKVYTSGIGLVMQIDIVYCGWAQVGSPVVGPRRWDIGCRSEWCLGCGNSPVWLVQVGSDPALK